MKGKKAKIGEIDFIMFATIILLVVIGVSSVYSASYNVAYFRYGNSEQFLIRQGLYAAVGLTCMLFLMKVDYHKYKQWTIYLIIVTLALLIVVLFMPEVNGARRWINLKVITIQPSELAKYVVVLMLAAALERNNEKMDKVRWVAFYFGLAFIFAFLVVLEKNLSIFSVIMGVTFIMLFVNGMKWVHTFGLAALGVGGIALLAIIEPYRMKRITSFRNPWIDPKGSGYQLIQSLYALASGGILGVGVGQSRQKRMYIPEPHNDFIFSIIGEEIGLIGCIAIISLYVILIFRGFKTAVHAKDTYGALIAIGITSVIAVQAVINIAVVTGSMPVTGVPLPFISYGGSALIFNLLAMGILLNISRQTKNKR